MSLQRNMNYPGSIPKSVVSLGFPFLSKAEVFFQWPELLTQTFADLQLDVFCYSQDGVLFLKSVSSMENRTQMESL